MADWARKFFRPGGGDALLAYILFGDFGQLAACSASRYDTAGLPDGVQVGMNLRAEQPELFDEWETGPFGDQLRASGLYDAVAGSKAMLRVLGSVGDPESLDYLRDSVGVVTCLLDQGGVCVLDLQTFRWWSPADWTSQIFAAHEPQPRRHAVILFSDEEAAPGLSWYHTRGMRKFGRPDLSVHAVPPDLAPAVIDLLNRFIEMEAFGAIIDEGQEIRMASLPEGLTCRHGGELEDPDFNNVHVEIVWPAGSPGSGRVD
jgi:hypothetical protein